MNRSEVQSESYCNYCWAKHHSNGCICPEDSKEANCLKAKKRKAQADQLRAAEKARKELRALKSYLDYIAKRIVYLNTFSPRVPLPEYKYYVALQNSIRDWGMKHFVFYRYIRREISMDEVKAAYGVNLSECFRLLQAQRRQLVTFISKQEEILKDQHPYIPFTNILED